MSAFKVIVRIPGHTYKYPAIAKTSADAISNAIDVFGIAAVTVTPFTEVTNAI